ncbi:MAG TPA: hypothetical protein VM370_03215 [Candidatus Thermoplasmatota archaeon]|nr:hypothetical protein [Candidatus Thermoplasmatota archaeon]
MPPELATVRVNVVVPSAIEAAFRAEVFARKGMRKGNISEAITEAIRLWIGHDGEASDARKPAQRPIAKASPRRRTYQEIETAKMTPGERMELAYKLSRFMRS